jgi:hypothetical protein
VSSFQSAVKLQHSLAIPNLSCSVLIFLFLFFLSFFPQDQIPNLQGFGDGKGLEVFNFRLFENKAR